MPKQKKARKPLTEEQKASAKEYKSAWAKNNPKTEAQKEAARIQQRMKRSENPPNESERKENARRASEYYWKNKEVVSIRAASYRALNKEKIKKSNARYNMENKDAISERGKINRGKKKPETAKRSREWYLANQEKCAEASRRWSEANPEKVAEVARNSRCRRRKAEGSHTAADIKSILTSQRGLCASCETKLFKSGKKKYHVDHIHPLSKGGSNDKYNLQCLCPQCNLRKNAKDPIAWANENGRLL